MGKLWTITKREYLERVRTKWFLVGTLLAPVLFGLIILLPVWFASRTQPSPDIARIMILDASGSGLGKRIASQLNGGPFGDTLAARAVEIAPGSLAAAESGATRAVMGRESKGYLVVDSSTLSALRARYAGANASSRVDMDRLQRTVRDQVIALRLERAGLDPRQIKALAGVDLRLQAERLTERGRGGAGRLSEVFAFGVGLLLYMSIFLYGQNVLRGVIEEKQTRVSEIVVSSVSPTTLLAGKVIGVGAVGITQLLLSILASVALAKLRGPFLAHLGLPQLPLALPQISAGIAVLLVAYFLLGYLFYAALFAAVGATVSSENEAQQVQLPVAMLLVVSALFIQPVLISPESATARILSSLPFSAPIVMPLRLSLVPLPVVDIVVSLVSLVAGCYIAVWLAARIYRTGLLMYGKRPTLAEMMRWVGQAR